MSNSQSAQLGVRCLLGYLLVLLLFGLIGCTSAARQEVNATPAPVAALTLTAVIAQADTPPAATTTASRLAPSRTPKPPVMGDGGPLQPEATATATATPPTPATSSPMVTPMPTSTEVEGWLFYQNDFLGYRFSYPPEAKSSHSSTTGSPNDLCVSVRYQTGSMYVSPRSETEADAVACGITGIGDQRIEQWQETITIDGESYIASAYRLYNRQTDQFENEFYILLDVNDNLRIDFGVDKLGAPRSGQPELSEQEFNEVRETVLQIVTSFRFFPPQTGEG